MDLTEKQLFDFMKCPVYYDSIHNKNLPVATPLSMKHLLEKVTSYFFINLMSGKVLSTENLKRKWDRLCEDNMTYMTPQRCLEGLGLIIKMYLWAQNEEFMIADMKTPYTITIKSSWGIINLNGEIAVISVDRNGKNPQLLITDFSNKYPNQSILDMKLKYTLDNLLC